MERIEDDLGMGLLLGAAEERVAEIFASKEYNAKSDDDQIIEIAEEIVAWVRQIQVEVNVDYGSRQARFPENDLMITLKSENDSLLDIRLSDLLTQEIGRRSETDQEDRHWDAEGNLSSAEGTRRNIAKSLRALADRVEKMKGDL